MKTTFFFSQTLIAATAYKTNVPSQPTGNVAVSSRHIPNVLYSAEQVKARRVSRSTAKQPSAASRYGAVNVGR